MSRSDLNDEIRDLDAATESEHAADPVAARKKAMDFLARRDHAADELKAKLEKAGFNSDTAVAAIARLRDEGLQSDVRFVEAFVQSRINQGKGPQRIRVELRQRGVADGDVDRAIDVAAVDWGALASAVRSRKFGDQWPADYKERARQMRFLQYRGFDSAQIRAALGDD